MKTYNDATATTSETARAAPEDCAAPSAPDTLAVIGSASRMGVLPITTPTQAQAPGSLTTAASSSIHAA